MANLKLLGFPWKWSRSHGNFNYLLQFLFSVISFVFEIFRNLWRIAIGAAYYPVYFDHPYTRVTKSSKNYDHVTSFFSLLLFARSKYSGGGNFALVFKARLTTSK